MSELVVTHYLLVFGSSSVIVVLGALLLGVNISADERLKSFRLARRYLSLSYFILGAFGFFSFFMQEEAEDPMLLATSTLVIASFQALLFTMTVLTFIQPLYVKKRLVVSQLLTIAVAGIVLFLALYVCSRVQYLFVFSVAVAIYLYQLIYYVRLFRAKYAVCLASLEEYYDEDEYARLRWVKFCFYSATSIGVLALTSLSQNLFLYEVFTIAYTAYYAYMVCRVYNYQIDSVFIIPVVTKKSSREPHLAVSKEEPEPEPGNLAERREHLEVALDKWTKEKKYARQDLGIDEIAAQLGTDIVFLRYYFKTYIGSDFRTWRLELRVCEARSMMESQPELSTNQICELVGISDRSNFHRQFCRIAGMTPAQYRKSYSLSSSKHKL